MSEGRYLWLIVLVSMAIGLGVMNFVSLYQLGIRLMSVEGMIAAQACDEKPKQSNDRGEGVHL